jgi:prepilin-type N-terminal cleavage/methylation domain-containing protein
MMLIQKMLADWQSCPFNRGRRRASWQRCGFTLIEVMLAFVLASMLSVVVIQLMRTTLLETRRIAARRQPSAETWMLRELLESDISNTRAYRVSKDMMILGGFLTSDLPTGAKTQQLSLVTYQLVRRGERMALERAELPFHSQQSQPRKEIVWYGVSRIVAFPQAEYLESISSTIPELQQTGLQSLSGGMIVRIYDTDNNLLLEIH